MLEESKDLGIKRGHVNRKVGEEWVGKGWERTKPLEFGKRSPQERKKKSLRISNVKSDH